MKSKAFRLTGLRLEAHVFVQGPMDSESFPANV